jgi:heparan-alpha-glucosaminide N-acetyltransferase
MADTYRLSKQEGSVPEAPLNRPSATDSSTETSDPAVQSPGRLASLDAYRGFIMFVLAASGFGIARFASLDSDAPAWQKLDYDTWQTVAFHFEHSDWRSNFLPTFLSDPATPAADRSELVKFCVSFWDLIQPAFMFMVGVAMPFSYSKRTVVGQSKSRRVLHALWRAIVLVLMGVFLASGSGYTDWVFPNVLCQIGLGYFFMYLLLGRKLWIQLTALVAILVGYWFFFYQYQPPANYDYAAVNATAEKGEVLTGRFASWSKNGNAAHRFDRWFLNLLRNPDDEALSEAGIEQDAESWAPQPVIECLFANPTPFKYNEGGYQTLNFVPSMGTMLLGVICGQLLLCSCGHWKKIGILLGAGALCMLLGLVAAQFACPIVKRIWTPSWTLFSGAYVIWMLALFYFLFDVLPLKVLAFPLVVVGMNSILMYMMGQLIHGWTIDRIIETHFAGMIRTAMGPTVLDDNMFGRLILPIAAAIVFWLVAFWCYRKKVFIRV